MTVFGAGTRVHAGIRVHRTSSLAPRDTARHLGIPVASPARTLLDLAATLPLSGLRRAVRSAPPQRHVHVNQLVEVLQRLAPRRGSRNLARIVATGPAPTRSELEDVVLDLVLRGGLAHPDVNVPLTIEASPDRPSS